MHQLFIDKLIARITGGCGVVGARTVAERVRAWTDAPAHAWENAGNTADSTSKLTRSRHLVNIRFGVV